VNPEPPLWRLPDAPLRASVFTSQLIGLAAVVALGNAARAGLPLGDKYVLKAAGLFAAIAWLSIGFLQQHHPFARFGGPNQVTTARAILVTLIAGLVGETAQPVLAGAAAVASLVVTLLDGVDGWLARRSGLASRFGARFDMETDALLILVLSILVWTFGKAGVWVLLSGLLRYVFVAAGSAAPWLRGQLPPSRRRQAICVVQITGLTMALVPAIEPAMSALISAIALAALCYSFLIDTVWLWNRRA
jgi:phosphatidylglycerophosphate synthase